MFDIPVTYVFTIWMKASTTCALHKYQRPFPIVWPSIEFQRPHNLMVTTLGLSVKWPYVSKIMFSGANLGDDFHVLAILGKELRLAWSWRSFGRNLLRFLLVKHFYVGWGRATYEIIFCYFVEHARWIVQCGHICIALMNPLSILSQDIKKNGNTSKIVNT